MRLVALVVATACLADAALVAPGRPAFARVKASSARINRVGPAPLMFFDQFDKDAMRVIMDAQVESRNLGGTEVEAQHLLLAATIQKGPVQKSLQRSGVESETIKAVLNPGNAAFPALDRLFAATSKDELLPFAKDTERAFRASLDRCQKRGELVSSQELIFSVLQDEQADSSAARLLAALKLDRAEVASEVEKGEALELVGAGGGANRKNSTLAQCSVDLTAKARAGLLDPVIGRSDEVRRCLQVLCRRRKNNPVLLGDPGVGKTAIAEGLAQMIADGKVPQRLKDKRLISLELGMLVADTKYRGEFEERLKNVVEEVTQSNDTILFIDELHTLVGAGAAEGAIDAANILKPALARGELQCIGATTLTEYRQYIEKDAALERRFQPVEVPEPSVEETVEILRGLQSRYAEHHNVIYLEESLEAAAKLADRYINDRFLPDKAIDLIDEAAAVRSLEGFEVEGGAEQEAARVAAAANAPLLEVSADNVASVVAQWTGVPVNKLREDESRRMLDFEGELHKRVIGQDGAVSSIARALRRARVGLRNPRRPVSSLVFSGPTGVGKTELAKAVAESYYGAEKAMVRIDMSEYMEAHAVSRLTGPPPGYVGYEAGGQLTEAVRRYPHTVVLLDEVEKAHPDVFNVLLQVLEDGRLTDNKGRTVSFRESLLIMTSNVGSKQILQLAQAQERAGGGPAAGLGSADGELAASEDYRAMRSAVKEELGNRFKPEFLNRLDEVVVFSSLARPEVEQVAALMIDEVVQRCAGEPELTLSFTPALKDAVVTQGYSATYGARPLRRAVQRLIEDPVAEAVLDGYCAGGTLQLDVDASGNLLLRNARGEQRSVEMRSGAGIEDDWNAAPAEAAAVGAGGVPVDPEPNPMAW